MAQKREQSKVLIVGIVDDDDAFRRSIARLLRSFGFKVHEYESAQKFLDSDVCFLSDCLIVDLRMPETDGLQLVKQLLEMKLRIPTIFVSGDVREGDRERARELGGSLLEKPFEADSLHKAIEGAVYPRSDG